MGIFDNLRVSAEVELPEFPDGVKRGGLGWQTKSIGHPAMDTYRITGDGRLEKKYTEWREKTDEEKQAEAEENGFSTWNEMYDWADPMTEGGAGGMEELMDRIGHIWVREQVKERDYWGDVNYHGSFRFYVSSSGVDGLDEFLEYEARFTEGELVDVVKMSDG